MADTAIFKLNTTDYSAHVVAESYAINYEDVYQEWTDGGQVKHRDVIGRKLRGTMQMYFKSQSDLQTFLTALANCKTTASTYPVQLKANNDTVDSLVASKNVFLDFKPVRKRDATWADVFEVFEVTIEEP
jgi:hypothetical protein